MSDDSGPEPELIHQLKNQLAVIVGFAEFLLAELPEGEVRKDVAEIHKAAMTVIDLVPRLGERSSGVR